MAKKWNYLVLEIFICAIKVLAQDVIPKLARKALFQRDELWLFALDKNSKIEWNIMMETIETTSEIIGETPDQTPKKKQKAANLPPIPQKRYFSIGEVSTLCDVKAHVLRYWEQEFPQLNPSKRRGNRRYYQYKDVIMIRQIRSFLYEQGFTTVGARQQLSVEKKSKEPNVHKVNDVVRHSIAELEELLDVLKVVD